MRLDIAALTDTGRRKRQNEDYYGVYRDDSPDLALFKEGALLCVADGLGGHTGGAIASKLAVSMVRDSLKQAPPPPNPEAEIDEGPLAVIAEGIRAANANIFKTNQELLRGGKPMGTTVVACLVTPRKAYIANVGDSRCYHLRDGEIIDMTEDHSWVDEQVKLGLMSKQEAEKDDRKNIVTRSIGTAADVEVDRYIWHLVPGDVLLLCSDGLVNMVKDADIRAEFQKRGTAAEVAKRLVDLANENGGKDNITVIVATVSPRLYRLLWLRFRAFVRRNDAALIWVFGGLVFGALCFTLGYYLGGGFK